MKGERLKQFFFSIAAGWHPGLSKGFSKKKFIEKGLDFPSLP